MGIAVPLVHAVEHAVGLMHGDHRRLGDHFERLVGEHDRDLDDAVTIGFEAGHLHVQPYQRLRVLCHNPSALFRGLPAKQ